MTQFNRKYSHFRYGQYERFANEHRRNVLPLAPPDWEARSKKQYLINTHYLPKQIDGLLNDSRINNTFYVLSKMCITHAPNVTIQIVQIHNAFYLNPYFEGINENIIFNQYCFIPEKDRSDHWIKDIKLKVNMLGGYIQETPPSNVDILIVPCKRQENIRYLLREIPTLNFYNCISVTLLNQIFRRYFNNYPIRD